MPLRHFAALLIFLSLGSGTACSLIAPEPTPSLVFPTAISQPSAVPSATSQPAAPPGTPTLPPVPQPGAPTLAPVLPTLAPQSTAIPQAQVKRLAFPPGGTVATMQGALAPNGLDQYVLRALAGQMMTVNFAPSAANMTMQISGADGSVFVSGGVRATTWSGLLPLTQDYFITVLSNATAPTTYSLQVTIPPLNPAVVSDEPRRISFPTGGTTATIQGVTATPGMDRFVIRVLGGQTMSVNISSAQGPAILIIYGADGNVLISDHAGASTWSGQLTATQDYLIDTRSIGSAAVNFTLQVTIPPLSSEPQPKRIAFPPGGTTAIQQSTLVVNGMDRWVLRALAGQTMTVNSSTTQGQVILIIFGVQDGNVLISDHAGATSWTGLLPSTEDYYIDVRSVGTVTANYTLQVTIPPP
ncbi:MAG TPA: hypothetical protein VF478_07675 [Anaerolineae bacterium]